MIPLSRYSTLELEQELKRRKYKTEKSPAGKCENCGEEWFFEGSFSSWNYEIQLKKFKEKHKDCLPILNGGYI